MTDLITLDTRQLAPAESPAGQYILALEAQSSRDTMQGRLSKLARLLTAQPDPYSVPWWLMKRQHLLELRKRLAEQHAPATVNNYLAALRGVLKRCRAQRLLDPHDLADYLDACKDVKGSRVPKGRSLAPGEISALMAACGADQSPAGARDAAMVAILYSCGLRRSELVKLDLDSFKPESGWLVVDGKGNKQREVHVQGGARAALDDWLLLRGDAPGALFWRIRRGGTMVRRRLSSQAVFDMLATRGAAAGVAEFSPHDLRRTLAGDLLDAGADIAIVQRTLGHADPRTTAKYDRRSQDAQRKAQAAIHVPYHRRTLG